MLWDAEQGRLLFELTRFDQDILYFTSVAKGSAPQRRARMGRRREGGVIQFQRVRSQGDGRAKEPALSRRQPAGRNEKGIDASFPDSIIASLPIIRTDAGR